MQRIAPAYHHEITVMGQKLFLGFILVGLYLVFQYHFVSFEPILHIKNLVCRGAPHTHDYRKLYIYREGLPLFLRQYTKDNLLLILSIGLSCFMTAALSFSLSLKFSRKIPLVPLCLVLTGHLTSYIFFHQYLFVENIVASWWMWPLLILSMQTKGRWSFTELLLILVNTFSHPIGVVGFFLLGLRHYRDSERRLKGIFYLAYTLFLIPLIFSPDGPNYQILEYDHSYWGPLPVNFKSFSDLLNYYVNYFFQEGITVIYIYSLILLHLGLLIFKPEIYKKVHLVLWGLLLVHISYMVVSAESIYRHVYYGLGHFYRSSNYYHLGLYLATLILWEKKASEQLILRYLRGLGIVFIFLFPLKIKFSKLMEGNKPGAYYVQKNNLCELEESKIIF